MKIANYYLFIILTLLPLLGSAQKSKLKAGDKLPAIVAIDSNEQVVNLKKFKGTYVYIDIWATWCEPCKKEIPHLQELEKKMKGKKIAFVSISCDKFIKKWQEFLHRQKLKGNQFHIPDDSQFAITCLAEGIPRFILLDRKGVIINPQMTRPSDPETLKTLEGLKGI